MIVEFSNNKTHIKSVLCHPDVYATIGGDSKPDASDYEPPDTALYILGYLDNVPIGCFILHQNGQWDWWCHVQVVPEYRKKYAREFGARVIRHSFENIPDCKKLVAQIPVCYQKVVDYALLFGFEYEGVNGQSYLKNGEWFDQYYLGLRRTAWDL